VLLDTCASVAVIVAAPSDVAKMGRRRPAVRCGRDPRIRRCAGGILEVGAPYATPITERVRAKFARVPITAEMPLIRL
jgi:hypothetical protein